MVRLSGLLMLTVILAPGAVQAECVTVPIGKAPPGPVAKPTLVFSGTVTEVDHERYTVSFAVDRVWTGPLKTATTFFIAPVVEGATARSFRPGNAYLVTSYQLVKVFTARDEASTGLPPGTVGVSFGCGDGPVPISEAGAQLKRLGRGRAPLP
jgi:hypothetical protein